MKVNCEPLPLMSLPPKAPPSAVKIAAGSTTSAASKVE
jgi:hypothetical protein